MIVVGYSGGSFGQACLEHGIAEAQFRETDLLVINAVSDGRGQHHVEAEEMAEVEKVLAASGVKYRLSQTIGSTPVDELLAAMDEPEAELLVIGLRRRTQVGKLLMGSTFQQLLSFCRKPILVVKPKRDDDQYQHI
ncbi:universal stress protein [Gordonia sp. (in: high G+C Gram-positive bacteria)]|uniref:universal stress protein n=1 Tax=Gordonia sp. (in: high G+C Gram-positive bacteria) TaxID=84139 RepID=UPI003C774A02